MKLFAWSKSKILLFVLLPAVIGAGLAWWLHGRRPIGRDIRHVVLISIDTCRADHLSCYGYSRETTPHIDAVADKGVLFENAYSPVPITLPAHCSMMTGTIPPYHGIHDNLTEKLSETNVTLAEILQENGYRTAAVVSAVVLESKFGLDQGFEVYQGEFTPMFEGDSHAEQIGSETTRLACNWLDNNSGQPFFLFLHYYDPHETYLPPEPFSSRFADNLYAGEIAYTDQCINQVIEKLKSLDLYDSTLIIITSDHGEMLGEHREKTHDYFVYQSAIRVPLIIKLPGARPTDQRINDPVALIDIMPTVLGLLEIPLPAHVQGQDLGGYIAGNAESAAPRYIYTESLTATEYKCNPLLAIVNWPWKYIYTTREELYHLQNDPDEKINLAQSENARARLLQNHLKVILDENLRSDQPDSNLELDQATIDRLRSLGYVGSGVEETFELDESKRDPKEYISFHERCRILDGARAAQAYEESWKLCTQLLSERPDLEFLYIIAGDIAIKTDRMEEAITYYQRHLKFEPTDYKSRNNLATALGKTGKLEEAIVQWQKVIRQEPDYSKAYNNLAAALSRLGQLDEAVTYWQETLRLQPDNFQARIGLAETLYRKGDMSVAIKNWDKALQLQPRHVKIQNDLAWVLATIDNDQLRNPDKALHLARQACELTNYKQPSYLDTLAVAYAAAGQFPPAIENAQKAINLALASGKNQLAQRIRKRMDLYKTGQTYTENSPPKN